jgi:uncharacterized protein (TIGR03067 family)
MRAGRSERAYPSHINRVIDLKSAQRIPDSRLRRNAVRRFVCWSVLVCVCAGPLARGDGAAGAKEEGKKMQGTWKPVTAELGGKPYPDEVLKTMTLVVADGKYTVTVGGQKDEGTVTLDPAKSPRAMDIKGAKGPNAGKTIPAIYELKGDTLRVCYDLSGKAHPKEFKTTAGTSLFLVEYKREKP